MSETGTTPFIDDEQIDSIFGQHYLKPSDVSKLFNVSESSIRKYIRDGRLKSIRVGGQHRIKTSEVKRFIVKNQGRYGLEQTS